MRVAIYESELCEKHLENLKSDFPEKPDRVKVISSALHEFQDSQHLQALEFLTPEPVTTEDLRSIHSSKHIQNINSCVTQATEEQCVVKYFHDSDVLLDSTSNEAALSAAGAMRDAVKLVYSGQITKAFCNVRPPGHHAHSYKAEGFCLYNNVWFGVTQARKIALSLALPAPRIAIIDWDVHHGDGTENFVLRNTDLPTYFLSLHQKWTTIWPRTGKECYKQREQTILSLIHI